MATKPRVLRRYESIWREIKKQDGCVVQVIHPKLVERVKKGVIKEKDRDVGFKLMNMDEKFRLRIEWERDTNKLKFELTQRLGMAEKVLV